MNQIVPATLDHAPDLEATHLSVIYTDTGGNGITLASSLYSVTGIGTTSGGAVTYPLSGSPLTGLTNTSAFVDFSVSYEIASLLSGNFAEGVGYRTDKEGENGF